MSTYFDFCKKNPFINKDDIYIKNCKLKDSILILEYSNKNLEAISVDLSSFNINKQNYINDAEFTNDNNLVLKYNDTLYQNLSINLNNLNKYITNVNLLSNNNILELVYNDNLKISANISSLNKNNYINNWKISNNKLILNYNDSEISALSIDLEQLNSKNKLLIIDNKLAIIDDFNNTVSVDLEKYSYNDFITSSELNNDNTLILKYTNKCASGNAKNLSIDLARFSRNYYIDDINLSGNQLIFNHTNPEIENISINLSSFNKYITSADIQNNILYLKYNQEDINAISIDISEFIKDQYIKEIKLSDDNKLYFKYNLDNNTKIDPIDLTKFDTYINNVYISDDVLVFEYSTTNENAKVVNLTKYINNNLTSIYLDDSNNLKLKYKDNAEFSVPLEKLNKYINSYQVDQNAISLINNDGSFISLNKNELNLISSISLNNSILQLNDSANLTVDLKQSNLISSISLNNSILQLNDSANLTVDLKQLNLISSISLNNSILEIQKCNETNPYTINLSTFDNQLTNHYFSNDLLVLEYANNTYRHINCSSLNTYISNCSLNNNILSLTNNKNNTLSIDLSKFDNQLARIEKNNNILSFIFPNDKHIDLDLHDINYELTSGFINNDGNIELEFSNDKNNIVIDSSKIKSKNTYINNVSLNNDDVLILDYNTDDIQARAVNLHKFARNDYITSGRYDISTKKLILNYNDQDGFQTKLKPISIDLSINIDQPTIIDTNSYVNNGHFDIENKNLILEYNDSLLNNLSISFNVLSNLNFKTSDNLNILSIAQTLEKIVNTFGGNRDVVDNNELSNLTLENRQLFSANSCNIDTNSYVNNGHFDIENKNLILEYNDSLLNNLSISFNVLSDLTFHATDDITLTDISETIEKIVNIFGGNEINNTAEISENNDN